MKNTLVRLGALFLAIIMIFSVAGCGGEEIEYVYQYEDGTLVPEDELNGTNDDATESEAEVSSEETVESEEEVSSEEATESEEEVSSEETTESKVEETVSSKEEETVESKEETTESEETTSTSSSNKKPPSKGETTINDNVNPADYKGTEITYATWRNPAQYEDAQVVKDFEKKYDIKVNIDLISEADYTNTVLAKIGTGKAPDVYFSTYTFPYCIDALQPIDAAKLNLDEAIWDKALIDIATVNGKTYLVDTVGNIWKDEDMIFYNKKLFNDNEWTTPEEYYEAGKWTFETMKKCMQQVASLGTDYIGGAVHLEGLIHSAGASVIGMKDGKFYNGTTNDVTKKIMTWASEGLKEGWLSTTSIYTALNEFPAGNVGIAVLHSFGLKKTGYLRNMKASDIGFTYLPSWDGGKTTATSFVRGWGLCKGAQNPVAAGIFLRYYLDVNNYDTGSAFISKEAENFFFKLTSTATNDKNFYFCYGSGVNGVTGKESAVGDYISKPATADPAQVATVISSYQNEINADIAKLNEKLK